MKLCIALVVMIALILAGVGCSPKVAKTEEKAAPPPAETAPAEEEPVMEPMPLSDEAVFESLEMDAEMQEVFQTVYFDFDRYDLRPETIEQLQVVGAYLAEHPNVRVLAEGHCDEPGSSEYNIGLGERRANAVESYLVAYGISGNRIEITSYGKERPAFPDCDTPECHEKNRRVEWKLLAK
ncbi:MAG: OmpA family protein [Chitinivibrionales bacterium]|nr:OmpA family protein [Chitinivibrionales bacterium]